MREGDVDPVHANCPVEIRCRIFKVRQQRNAARATQDRARQIWSGEQWSEVNRRRLAYPHSRLSSSCFSIFRNLESLKALMRAYSAIPSRIGSGSKVPIHPRNLGARPGREDLVFQVTNSGLKIVSKARPGPPGAYSLLLVWEFDRDRLLGREGAVERIESMKAVLGKADFGHVNVRHISCGVGRY